MRTKHGLTSSTIIWALLILILGNLFATFSDVIVKLLDANVSIYQYLFIRQLILVLVIVPFWLKLPIAHRDIGSLKVHSFRALMTNIGAPCAVIALLHLPLATANVIFYTAPLLTLLLAAIIFAENLTRQRILITISGFCGVAIALRPESIGFAGLIAFGTAFAVAAYNLSVKWLPKSSSTINTIFWSNLLALPLIAIIAAFNWQPLTQELIVLAVGSCVCLVAYQGCCIIAFQKAEASAITVAEYSGLVFAALLGWIIFKESVDVWTLVGITLIILPIVWQSWFEYQNNQRNLQQKIVG